MHADLKKVSDADESKVDLDDKAETRDLSRKIVLVRKHTKIVTVFQSCANFSRQITWPSYVFFISSGTSLCE